MEASEKEIVSMRDYKKKYKSLDEYFNALLRGEIEAPRSNIDESPEAQAARFAALNGDVPDHVKIDPRQNPADLRRVKTMESKAREFLGTRKDLGCPADLYGMPLEYYLRGIAYQKNGFSLPVAQQSTVSYAAEKLTKFLNEFPQRHNLPVYVEMARNGGSEVLIAYWESTPESYKGRATNQPIKRVGLVFYPGKCSDFAPLENMLREPVGDEISCAVTVFDMVDAIEFVRDVETQRCIRDGGNKYGNYLSIF